jgi:LysM repeat protein
MKKIMARSGKMGANEIKIAGTEKEDKTTTVKCKLTHTVEDGVYAHSIKIKYNMTLEELKQCNKDNKKVLPNGVNGDFVLHVGDVLNVKGKATSITTVNGNQQPTPNFIIFFYESPSYGSL